MDSIEQTIAALQAQDHKEIQLSSEHAVQAEKWEAAAAHEHELAGEHERLAGEAFQRGDDSAWMTEHARSMEHTSNELSARAHVSEEQSQEYAHAAAHAHLAGTINALTSAQHAVDEVKSGFEQEQATLLGSGAHGASAGAPASAFDPSAADGSGHAGAAHDAPLLHHDDGFDGGAP